MGNIRTKLGKKEAILLGEAPFIRTLQRRVFGPGVKLWIRSQELEILFKYTPYIV